MNSFLRDNLRQLTMVLALLGIWLCFFLLTDGVFLTSRNLSNLFIQTATTAILAIGMVLVIVSGHIDLSVGSVMGFCGAVAVLGLTRYQMPTLVTLLITLLVGMAIGAWHGYWVAYRKVPPFIVTLASMLAFRGAIIGLTGGQTLGLEMAIDAEAAANFAALGQGYLPTFYATQQGSVHDSSLLFALLSLLLVGVLVWRRRRTRQRYGLAVLPRHLELLKLAGLLLALGGFFAIMVYDLGIPYSILITIFVSLTLQYVASHTVFGRRLYAVGGNAEAARLSGIPVQKQTLQLFILMGALVALAGLVSSARLNAATTSAGQNAELDAIAAAVIGGTTLMGGQGTIAGALVGALVMTSLDNGMSLMNLDITYQFIIKGLILLLAVWADMESRRKS